MKRLPAAERGGDCAFQTQVNCTIGVFVNRDTSVYDTNCDVVKRRV